MPRIGVGGGGGGGNTLADKKATAAVLPTLAPSSESLGAGSAGAATAGLAGWLGGATRSVTGNAAGGSYVVLGGTRYGLRLSQDSIPPASSREESLERRRYQRNLDSQQQNHQTEQASREPVSPNCKQQANLDLVASDCCCIGSSARSRLLPLGSRIPLSWNSSSSSASRQQQQPNSANNSQQQRCWAVLQTSFDSRQQQQQQQGSVAAANNGTSAPSSSSFSSSTSSASSSSSSAMPASNVVVVVPAVNSGTLAEQQQQQQQQQSVALQLPRQLTQWSKHQSLRLQEPAVTAVDRLQRFRWSGGGGGSSAGASSSGGGKKSSRNTDKTGQLRELTEKLKGPAPVPPPRRPSRANASSPNGDQLQGFANASQSSSGDESRSGCRSYTFSEGSRPLPNKHSTLPASSSSSSRPRLLGRSESVGEEYTSYTATPGHGEGDGAGVDTALQVTNADYRVSNGASSSCDASDALSQRNSDNIASEVDKSGTGKQPARSSSFGQFDLSYVDSSSNGSGSRQSSALANARRAAFAASSTSDQEARASTLPRCCIRPHEESSSPPPPPPLPPAPMTSPFVLGASTPSLADSALGSAEGQQPSEASTEDAGCCFRPRSSDGSDSVGTSSIIASPEPSHSGPILEDPRDRRSALLAAAGSSTDSGEQRLDGCGASKDNTHKDHRIEPHEVIITPPQEDLPQVGAGGCNLRLSQASEASEAPSEMSYTSEASTTVVAPSPVQATAVSTASPGGKLRRYRGDTSKRRKGVYITQWPEPAVSDAELRSKLSGQSSEERDEPPPSATPSDLSDCEGHTPRRYSKRPLRGPYGQMLEAEMAKPRVTDLVGLEDGLRPRRKVSANLSFNASSSGASTETAPTPCHHRTTSSPSKLEGLPAPSPELLAELLRGSSERVARAPANRNDTRTHVVVELYDTERSYVEALQILVNKYLQQLKSPENAHLVDATIVDEIFYQVPAILSHHEVFLEELRKRLETWELQQTIGDVFLEVFTKPAVLETYTLFLDNWKSAKKAIKTTCQAKPAFARFLETMEREHKGKLGLDQLLIKPVQKIPRYELLIQRLLKHTDHSHPDYQLLTAAQKEVHELVVRINCTERESLEWEQQQTTLREVQAVVEGLAGIVTNDRAFIRHDFVSITSNQGTRKERAIFLFSDLLVITSIKRRSGTIRKPSTSTSPNNLVGVLEANKYKMLMRISLDDLEVMKAKDENLRRMAREVDFLRDDVATLTQLHDLAGTLHGAKQQLEELVKEMLAQTRKQLAERNAAHSQLACLELTLNTQAGMENISVIFAKPDKRASWEESFNEAKAKLAASTDRRPVPEFVGPLPIRKTRAGLQFTCAAPTLVNGQGTRDVWVCNSDGYVGQVCVLSLNPEPPQVTSCNGVCNARILCVAGIPACTSVSNSCTPINSTFINNKSGVGVSIQNTDSSSGNIQLDSSSSDDSDSDEIPCADNASVSIGGDLSSLEGGPIDEDFNQPTMWLGTEDGCVHVYNCSDNIRIKKNKVKLQHGSSVHCIIYLDNKVFVSLANGDITVYSRDHMGGWNTAEPTSLSVGTVASPVAKMLPVSGKLWCATHNNVKILNTYSLEIELTFSVSSDNHRPISCMASSGGLGVWISLHNSAVLKLFHATSYECLSDINIAPAVTNMLANCDDIIRQHKAACLRVTALLACNELLWIGTSAGVLLTVPIPHIKPSTQRMSQAPVVTGLPHGHTGHVRFLTCVEIASPPKSEPRPKISRYSLKGSKSLVAQHSSVSSTSSTGSSGSCGTGPVERGRLLVISGGDGYEDFRGPQSSAELQAGREDSTNHLLLWKV